MSGDPRWRVNPACRLHWRHWGEQIVLFNAASGQTHFVNEFTYHLVQALDRAALDSSELSAIFDDDGVVDDTLRPLIDDLIATLDELGIVEPVVP